MDHNGAQNEQAQNKHNMSTRTPLRYTDLLTQTHTDTHTATYTRSHRHTQTHTQTQE